MGAWVSYLLGGRAGETTAVKEAPEEPAGFDEVDPATGLTPRQKQAVVQTWALVQPEMRATGIALLIALFEAYPEHQDRFDAFRGIPLAELRTNKKFAAHASTVVHAVASIVDSLDDTECLVELLLKTGKVHKARNIPAQAFADLKEVLLKLLKAKLGTKLTPVAEEAWDKTLAVANSVICQQLSPSKDDEDEVGAETAGAEEVAVKNKEATSEQQEKKEPAEQVVAASS